MACDEQPIKMSVFYNSRASLERLDRFCAGGESDGSASCVAFSDGGRHIAVGYSKGFVKIINAKSGVVEEVIAEAVQIGRGVLEILYLGSRHTILTLDNGGSVFEMRTRLKFRLGGKSRIRCVFSGCNGEVFHMRLMPYSLLAFHGLLNLSSCCFPPLLDFIEEASLETSANGAPKGIRICVGRGNKLSMFRLSPQHLGGKKKSVVFTHKVQLKEVRLSYLLLFYENKPTRFKSLAFELQGWVALKLQGLTTGGNVSPAMQCLADMVCYQSLCRKGSEDALMVLSHDEIFEITLLSEDDQLELFTSRGDLASACFYLYDIHRGRVRADKKFLKHLPNRLAEYLRRLVDVTMGGCKEGKVSDLVAHYKNYISVLLTVCVGTHMYDFLYNEIWSRVERDVLSRYIFLESLDEFVLDGTLESPPPDLVSAYITHLASEGHFSQLQASVVRFPIQCIDLHYVMSTCKQNGLYDGIIYVMNKALGDYLSPLEEMLDDVLSFASNEMMSDSEVERGNRLLLYLHCCLAGHTYPYGSLPPEQLSTVPLQVYRCITSLKGKDGSSSGDSYPYLRLLLLFDAQQFTHVIRTCADAPVFQSEGRLQRLIENIGRLSIELRNEAALVHFLLLTSQLVDTPGVVTPVEIVEDVVTTLMRMEWQHSSAEFAIVETLRVVPQIDRVAVLLFISIVSVKKGYMVMFTDPCHGCAIFSTSRDVVERLTSVSATDCADLVIDCFPNYFSSLRLHSEGERIANFPLLRAAFAIKYRRQESFLQMDEEAEEHLFGIVFESLVKEGIENLDSVLQVSACFRNGDLLLYWLPTGSRTDYCLNLAAAAECTNTTLLLLETRNRLDDAFEILFKQIMLWLDRSLSFCSRHTSFAHSKGWLMSIMRLVTRNVAENDTAGEFLHISRFWFFYSTPKTKTAKCDLPAPMLVLYSLCCALCGNVVGRRTGYSVYSRGSRPAEVYETFLPVGVNEKCQTCETNIAFSTA
ncbi:unnamed protein product [Heligmosomoides polygyrus]|uniref:Vacuolar protein sorting-associated protein 8 central domain-containing protein n=1 Tax=Heligmosomoides polygyrus TaxID=6339 RepID=A0A3P7YAP5_HELPZ|nr:unnamed protein product [Heligmosomoides polygyrus]